MNKSPRYVISPDFDRFSHGRIRAMMARRSRVEVYLHFVWATKGRADRLSPEWERVVYRCIHREVERMGCAVLGIGGTANHVHVVVCASGRSSPAQLAMQMKGVSSALVNREAEGEPDHERFCWQDGYGCFSLGRPQLDVVLGYVRDQKRRHGAGDVWGQWEAVDRGASLDLLSAAFRPRKRGVPTGSLRARLVRIWVPF